MSYKPETILDEESKLDMKYFNPIQDNDEDEVLYLEDD